MSDGKTELKIEVDRDKLEGVFVASLMQTLSREDAQEMVHKALIQILERDHTTKTLLEKVAAEVIREHLSDPGSKWRARMRGLVEAALARALESDALAVEYSIGSNSDKPETGRLVNQMAQAFVRVLTRG